MDNFGYSFFHETNNKISPPLAGGDKGEGEILNG
jgi:hypothetical protein